MFENTENVNRPVLIDRATAKQTRSKMGDDDPHSLEYIEDPYFPKLPNTATPSLDDEITEFDHRSLYDDVDDGIGSEWSPETELYLRNLPLDQIFSISDDHEDDFQKVEAELGNLNGDSENSVKNRRIDFLKKLFNRKSMRDVKVTFIDFSKPYLAKISSSDNYKNFLNIGSQGSAAHTLQSSLMINIDISNSVISEISLINIIDYSSKRSLIYWWHHLVISLSIESSLLKMYR